MHYWRQALRIERCLYLAVHAVRRHAENKNKKQRATVITLDINDHGRLANLEVYTAVKIETTPKRLSLAFGSIVAALVTAHVVTETIRFVTGDNFLLGLVPLFSIGSDKNLPTFYSSFAILFCAILLTVIARAAGKDRATSVGYWYGMAAVFLFLALDEMLELHEKAIDPLREMFNASGLLYYTWVVPYGIGTLVFAAVYARFLLRLCRRTRILFVSAGAIYVLGAIGIEMLSGLYFESHGGSNPVYVALQTVEETLEMAGIVIFIFALAEYLDRQFNGLQLVLSSRDSSTTHAT